MLRIFILEELLLEENGGEVDHAKRNSLLSIVSYSILLQVT